MNLKKQMIYPLLTVSNSMFWAVYHARRDATPQGPEEVNRIGRPGDDVDHCDPAWIHRNPMPCHGGDEKMVPTGVAYGSDLKNGACFLNFEKLK